MICTDMERVKKMLYYAERLNRYIIEHRIIKADLMNDLTLQWLVTTPLYNIGEQAYMLSKEFKGHHADVPWAMISGLRHRLVHDYDGTNWNCCFR